MQTQEQSKQIQEFNMAAAVVARTVPGKRLEDVAKNSSDCFWGEAHMRASQDAARLEGLYDISHLALRRLGLDELSLVDLLAQYAAARLIGEPLVIGNTEFGVLRKRVAAGSTPLNDSDTRPGQLTSGSAAQLCIRNAGNRSAVSSLFKKAVHKVRSSGTTPAAVLADIVAAATALAVSPGSKLFLIVDPITATRLALKSTDSGELAFPEMSMGGGQIGAAVHVFVVDASLIPTPGDGSRNTLLVDASGLVVDAGKIGLGRKESSNEGRTTLGLDAVRIFGLDQLRPAVAIIEGVHW